MKLVCTIRLCLGAIALAIPLSAAAVYPEKPVRLVVPFPPGGGTDASARLIANALSGELKQQVVVENRAGAAGAIGAQAVVDSAPDGYALFFATTGALAINPHLYSKLRYDPLADFSPVALVATFANVLVVHPSVAAKSVAELVALAKSKPGAMTYASSGAGSSSHLAAALFESMTGTKFTHVPYKGTGPALADFLSGRIDLMIDNITTHAPLARQGKVRALGISGSTPAALLPGVPTIAAAGVPGYDVTIWYAIVGPARMPADIVSSLSGGLRTVMGTPKMKESMDALGNDSVFQGPEEFGRFLRAEIQKWAGIVRTAGVKPE